MSRGLFIGFFSGVALTLAAACMVGYYGYRHVQKSLSSENTTSLIEEKIASIIGEGAQIEQAQIELPNMLTLQKVSFSGNNEPILTIEKIEAVAEGGIAGLKAGHFSEVILSNPSLTLKRSGGEWNFNRMMEDILRIQSAQAVAQSASGEITASTRNPSIGLRAIQIKNLALTIQDEAAAPEKLSIEEVLVSRPDSQSPWSILCRGSQVSIDTLLSKSSTIGILGGMGGEKDGAPPHAFASMIKGIQFENISLHLKQPDYELSIDQFSLSADALFKSLSLQTGSLEKKNFSPAS